jgi:hypothetical protein
MIAELRSAYYIDELSTDQNRAVDFMVDRRGLYVRSLCRYRIFVM